jgi:PAS domain S-box-containing protein
MAQLGYLISLGFACLLALWIGYNAWTNRGTTGARALVGVAMAAAVWTGGTFGLTLATSPTAELRWLLAFQPGVVTAPILFVVLALEYTGRHRYLTPLTTGGLLALGGGFLAIIWTNPLHELYWADINHAAATPTGLDATPGSIFWVFLAFSYLLLLVGSILFVRHALTAPHLYRSQSIAILIAVAVPWAANIPPALQFAAADFTPVALSVTTGALWWAMFRYRLADLSPVALRTVFESISTGVYVLDHSDRIVDVNAAGQEMLVLPEGAIGTRVQDILPDDDLLERVSGTEDYQDVVAIEGDNVPGAEASAVHHHEIQVTPIDSAGGRRQGRLMTMTDVTEQRRQQRQLEDQNERLENFTSVVSHDLRNPLNVASGNLTLAQEDCDSDYLDRAEQALARMETLIDDLLALAYGGTTVTEPEPVDLAAVTADAWDTVDTKRATLANRTENEIIADRSRLHQLIENLVRNAIEHGGETVTVTIGDRDGGFYVADDGPGIPADDREDVFEMGYSTREDGTGFGLNIVGQIADAHGWAIAVAESAEGGARFEITDVDLAEEASTA